jgi:hypothetical protein
VELNAILHLVLESLAAERDGDLVAKALEMHRCVFKQFMPISARARPIGLRVQGLLTTDSSVSSCAVTCGDPVAALCDGFFCIGKLTSWMAALTCNFYLV